MYLFFTRELLAGTVMPSRVRGRHSQSLLQSCALSSRDIAPSIIVPANNTGNTWGSHLASDSCLCPIPDIRLYGYSCYNPGLVWCWATKGMLFSWELNLDERSPFQVKNWPKAHGLIQCSVTGHSTAPKSGVISVRPLC